jgi:hypothetical protein
MRYELGRHIKKAKEKNDFVAVEALKAQKIFFKISVDSGVVKELPLEAMPIEQSQSSSILYELGRHRREAERMNDLGGVRALDAQETLFKISVDSGVVKELPLEPRPIEQPQSSSQEAEGIEIKRFSNEAKEALKKQGKYVFYELEGQSIKTERDANREFSTNWHNGYSDFESLPSMHSEVAINLNCLYILGSNNKTLSQQEAMVERFSKDLGKKVKGVKAVIGGAADYVVLTFLHLDKTTKEGKPDRLFGEKYRYGNTITKTPTDWSSSFAIVGGFNYRHHVGGLAVERLNSLSGLSHVYVAPLVVPE